MRKWLFDNLDAWAVRLTDCLEAIAVNGVTMDSNLRWNDEPANEILRVAHNKTVFAPASLGRYQSLDEYWICLSQVCGKFGDWVVFRKENVACPQEFFAPRAFSTA